MDTKEIDLENFKQLKYPQPMEHKSSLLINYLSHLNKSFYTNELIGRKLKNAYDFVSRGYPVSVNGYKDYQREHLSKDLSIPFEVVRQDILDFLNYNKVGYNRPNRKKKKVKTLEKLSGISERNREIIRQFNYKLLKDSNLSECTIRTYNVGIKMYFEHCNDISKENFRNFITSLEERKMKPQTICVRINSLNKLAETLGKPELKMKTPRLNRKLNVDNVFSEKEYNLLLDYLRNKNLISYYQIRIIASTGARISEFLQFEWEHLTWGFVDLKGKGNRIRRFFFPKTLANEMTEFANENNLSGYIFTNRFGNRMQKRGFAQLLASWTEKCELDKRKFHPHAFRHFFAKMYLKKNTDVVQLADLLGHESVDTTRRYLTKSFEEQRRDYNRIVNW